MRSDVDLIWAFFLDPGSLTRPERRRLSSIASFLPRDAGLRVYRRIEMPHGVVEFVDHPLLEDSCGDGESD